MKTILLIFKYIFEIIKYKLKKIESLSDAAEKFAVLSHNYVLHFYDKNKLYSYHLKMVQNEVLKYLYLLPENKHEIVKAGAWCHDTIEDVHSTKNDLIKVIGEEAAEIVYNVSNEKGRTRHERANAKYYREMRKNPLAVYVKLCDRLANMKYSAQKRSSMSEKYAKELDFFKERLYKPNEYEDIWAELERLSNI